MVSGVLFVAPPLLGGYYPQAYDRLPLPSFEALLVFGLALMPIGMLGFHALQRYYYGSIGLAGFWMADVAPLAVALGAARGWHSWVCWSG